MSEIDSLTMRRAVQLGAETTAALAKAYALAPPSPSAPWTCSDCKQRNSAGQKTCGRCDRPLNPNHNPKAQSAQAAIQRALRKLHADFRFSQMHVEEALVMLTMQLLTLEYAVRYRPDRIAAALKGLTKKREKLLTKIDMEDYDEL